MIQDINDTLNGGYAGLYGEVVDKDIYHLRNVEDIVSVNDPLFVHEKGHPSRINFVPDVIFDFGANIGVFTRYARTLFPNALIISIEPDDSNCEAFMKFTKDFSNIVFIKKAIGQGKIWRSKNAVNGSGENYLSVGLGYPEKELVEDGRMELSKVESVMPDEIINTYLKDGMRSILKLDIEGAENIIWSHKPSMDALSKIDYITGEIHFFGINAKEWSEVQVKTNEAFEKIGLTHNLEIDNVHIYATKK